MKKTYSIILIPTKIANSPLCIVNKKMGYIPTGKDHEDPSLEYFDLYFTEIAVVAEGEKYVSEFDNKINKHSKEGKEFAARHNKKLRKIIATTDETVKDVFGIPFNYIRTYIDSYNRGKILTEVELEVVEEMSPGWIPTYSDPDNAGLHPPSEPTGNYIPKADVNNKVIIMGEEKALMAALDDLNGLKLTKEHIVLMVSTKKEPQTGQIGENSFNKLIIITDQYPVDKEKFKPQHLHFISPDAKVRQGDWYIGFAKGIRGKGGGYFIGVHDGTPSAKLSILAEGTKKIVASTRELAYGYNPYPYTKEDYVPSIPESFINTYIETYNKGQVIIKVDLEMHENEKPAIIVSSTESKAMSDVFLIKTDSNNKVIIV